MNRRWESALAALCLAVAGLVGLAIVWAQPAVYADIASRERFAPATFRFVHDGTLRVFELPDLVGLHTSWLRYVTGRAGSGPGGTLSVDFFTRAELGHMADVRVVFIAVEIAALVASAVLFVLVAWVRSRGPAALARLFRSAAMVAGIGVAVLAAAAALSFDALFLAFHEVFFPQGNFLFDPATSNLLTLYPDEYWYGVTLRIGVSFVAGCVLIGAVAHATLRAGRR